MTEPEKLCACCKEWWPADTEFFFRNNRTKDGLGYSCKACFFESPTYRSRKACTATGPMYSPWERLFRQDEARAS